MSQMLLQVKNLSYSRGTKPLFDDLNFSISQTNRIGLVGHNGSGKTSLLNLLAGTQKADQGERIAQRNLRIGTMEQFVPISLTDLSLKRVVLEALPPEQQETEAWRAEAILAQLGFLSTDLDQPLATLSGGQRNLALFARAQLRDPELLLMDEPGNHMDVNSLQYLKGYLNHSTNITYVLISHDRELLDACCTHTYFLRDQRIYTFQLPYSEARLELQRQDQQAQQRHQSEQKEIDRVNASAKRLALWGKTYDNEKLARKAKTMAQRADKLAAEQTFVSRGSGLELKISGDALKSKTVFTLENLALLTEDQSFHLLDCEHLVAKPGDRIALVGANGCGKSTTIRRMLVAHQQHDAAIRFNPQVQIGYFDQELEGMEEKVGRFDWLCSQLELPDERIKQTLLHAGIAFQDFAQPIASLSGGEKARLRFMLLALQNASLMILDEPTNHIDLESREQLEKQLIEAETTLLVTSHDRAFLEAVCNRFWLIQNQSLQEIEYLETYYAQIAQDSKPRDGAKLPDERAANDTSDINIFDKIQELEDLIAADLARKPKFQKPERQAEWRAELDQLWATAEEQD